MHASVVVTCSLLTLVFVQMYNVGIFEVLQQLSFLPESLDQAGVPVDGSPTGFGLALELSQSGVDWWPSLSPLALDSRQG